MVNALCFYWNIAEVLTQYEWVSWCCHGVPIMIRSKFCFNDFSKRPDSFRVSRMGGQVTVTINYDTGVSWWSLQTSRITFQVILNNFPKANIAAVNPLKMPDLLGFLSQEHSFPPCHQWGQGQFWHLQAGVQPCAGPWDKDPGHNRREQSYSLCCMCNRRQLSSSQ